MKIHSLTTGTVGYSTRVREKQDGQSAGHSQDQNTDQPKQDADGEEEAEEVTYEEVEKAVESFQADSLTQGLNASVAGNGPGLKVVLKDGSGSVVKQLTGEEFLKLREKSSSEGKVRGKILDQKL